MPNPNWNHEPKKQKQKHDKCKTRIQLDLLQKWNKKIIRLWQENIPKINVKQIKRDGDFYFYLYTLGTQFKEVS